MKYARMLLPAILLSSILTARESKTPHSEFVKISDSPEIFVSEQFLSEEECDSLQRIARPLLQRSTVVDERSSAGIIDSRRTSSGTFLPKTSEPDAAKKIRQLAKELTGLPKKNGEDLQILHYGIGAEYQPHFDYFDPGSPGGEFHYRRGGQRVATLIVYLNTPDLGGETIFPKAKITVAPKKGKAVLFYNVDRHNRPDPRSFHGGAPVVAGEKWIATLWMREGTFR